jgi:hypothetical protein
MKKLITILISCSLTLAASAIAQQDEKQQKPKKEKAQSEKSHPANEAKPAPKPQSVPGQHAETKAPGQEKGVPKPQSSESSSKPHAMTKAPGKEPGNAKAGTEQVERRKKEGRAPNEPATASQQTSSAAAPQANRLNAQAKKPDPQQVQQIKSQHANFRAQPKPQQIPAVTYNQNYRIQGSDRWQGTQYEVFRSYHPEWHDQGWYRTHYNRVELIGGGYYYWNNGYWYPAWGYSPSEQYYAYDGPIYVGQHAEPPDKVIADVQGVLQQMGYYKGEVDGLLGPLTREALAAYQADNGLTTTAAIDEPTLDSLGMS